MVVCKHKPRKEINVTNSKVLFYILSKIFFSLMNIINVQTCCKRKSPKMCLVIKSLHFDSLLVDSETDVVILIQKIVWN